MGISPFSYCDTFNPERFGKSKAYFIPKRIKINNENIDAVGIDLGTSNCCLAVNRRNGIKTVALDNTGERMLPSYVSYDEKHEKCGHLVINRLRNYAKSTIFDVKKIIGKKYSEIKIDDCWPFDVINYRDRIGLKIQSHNGTTIKMPEEVYGFLLKFMKTKAEEFQGKPLSEVVIAIPPEYGISQISAIRDAAYLAGWRKIHFLPEPIAASFAYFNNRPFFLNETLLLLDLGGATLDVSILEILNDQIQIMSRSSNFNLGGRDFDNILVKHFLKIMINEYQIVEKNINKYKLKAECQKIKEDLSTEVVASLDIEDYDLTKFGSISITRLEFENLCKSLITKIIHTTFLTLSNIEYAPEEIDKTLLVGGGSRMPMIQSFINDAFPDAEHCYLEHPEEAVAIGAAYYAYDIFAISNREHLMSSRFLQNRKNRKKQPKMKL